MKQQQSQVCLHPCIDYNHITIYHVTLSTYMYLVEELCCASRGEPYAPINCWPHYPPLGQRVEEWWGFDQTSDQISHHLGRLGCQIPS